MASACVVPGMRDTPSEWVDSSLPGLGSAVAVMAPRE